MAAEHDIPIMINRLKRAGIPMDHLCYELDEGEWQAFMRYLEGFERLAGRDLTYLDDCHYMGLHIQKRRTLRT